MVDSFLKKQKQLINDLKTLLSEEAVTTQERICEGLIEKGHLVNQSKVSRLLRKLNVIKLKNKQGDFVYRLPHDSAPPMADVQVAHLIIDITANETMIVIKTSPGSASLIARILDHHQCEILGTIAGDDTIFIAPVSVKNTQKTLASIQDFLKN